MSQVSDIRARLQARQEGKPFARQDGEDLAFLLDRGDALAKALRRIMARGEADEASYMAMAALAAWEGNALAREERHE